MYLITFCLAVIQLLCYFVCYVRLSHILYQILNNNWKCVGKLTRLTCQRGKTLRVVGLSALGPHNRPPPPRVARCPYLAALRRQIAATCNGHRRCYVSSQDLRLTRKQCPGLAAVFIDVACSLRGGTSTCILCLLLLSQQLQQSSFTVAW